MGWTGKYLAKSDFSKKPKPIHKPNKTHQQNCSVLTKLKIPFFSLLMAGQIRMYK